MENKSGVTPTEFKLLVLPDKVDEKTKGGILRPQEYREREQAAATTGRIIAISPLAFSYADWPDGSVVPKAGDRIAFARYSGMTITGQDGIEYRLVNDKDVCAVVSEAANVT